MTPPGPLYLNSRPSHRPVTLPGCVADALADRALLDRVHVAHQSSERVQKARVVAMMLWLLAASAVVVGVEPVPVGYPDAVDDARSRVPGAIPAAAVAVHV